MLAGMVLRSLALLALALALAAPAPASAANVLFVSDFSSDTSIVPALEADGHTVTMIINDYAGGRNATLAGSLAGYDMIYWSATGGAHTDASVFSNLTAYVSDGGRVFVTGVDALSGFPTDTQLLSFLGGTGARDTGTVPGPVASFETSLTVGVVDIRGVLPTGSDDNDCLSGLGFTTLAIAANGTDPSCAQWSLRAYGAGQIAHVSSGSSLVWTNTSAGGAGAYNAAIRNFASSGEMGSSDPGAPQIRFEIEGVPTEGAEIEVRVVVEDLEGETYVVSWDLDGDGTYGENEGELSYVVAAGTTDGPAGFDVAVEAIDERGNRATRMRTVRVANAPPEITSEPPAVASIESDLAYPITAQDPAGELDPLSFALVTGPPRMSVTAEGVVSWIPGESDVTGPGETVPVEVSVSDDDGGVTSHRFELVVSRNRRPTPPLPVYPIDNVAVIARQPRLATQNSEDLDLDPLSYVFQIDVVDTFDSEALVESDSLPEMAGYTSWAPDAALDEGRLYHWRVRADDGTVYSEWRASAFYVVRDPALGPPDAGVPDGGRPSIPDAAIIPGIDAGVGGGGGCRVAPARGTAGAGIVALALALLVLRRRRL